MSNNYNQHINQRANNETVAVDERLTSATAEPEIVETETPYELKEGVVTDCVKLNVRENPSTDSDVLCEIPKDSEVMVDESESTDEFYKVYTNSGIEGYCVKKYISLED